MPSDPVTASRHAGFIDRNLPLLGVLLVLTAALGVGFAARSASAGVRTTRDVWHNRAEQLAAVQGRFRPLTKVESKALDGEARHLANLTVLKSEKMVLVDSIGRL